MKVFKFGGASVKDAAGVKNLRNVLEQTQEKHLVIVISAMGKMTNAFEAVVNNYFNKKEALEVSIAFVEDYHTQIIEALFPLKNLILSQKTAEYFKELRGFLDKNKSKNRAFVYDQVVPYGELLSTTIVASYLQMAGIDNNWQDVRKCIATNGVYRDASINWEVTQANISEVIQPTGITITQGFIGAEQEHFFTTTLGREGSDYTAAIFAYCLNAENVTIWKDVPGVLNADPRYFDKTTLLHHISYKEAIELAFYGASVIHPKTLQPLQRKEIPLYVKSFINPLELGTCVGKGVLLDPMVSCFILKKNQVLISLSSLDFSFMMENHIGDVFKWLHEYKMKAELIQNSAISFSVCIDNKFDNLEALITKLKGTFKVRWNEGVTLYTVRRAMPIEIEALIKNKTVLLRQESRGTTQLVVAD